MTFSSPTEPYGPAGTYGTLGIAAAGNIPGGRDSGVTWTDTAGNFWLFGGEGIDANGNYGQLNDLWEYQQSTQQWIWMGGSNALPSNCAGSTTVPCGQPGTYGTLGAAATSNFPGGRSAAAYWTDSNGYLWMFGGFGFDASGTLGELNDLWEFDSSAKQWRWMGGSSTVGSKGGQPGVYGTPGTAAAANVPGGRYSAAFWTDNNGLLWLYGGKGFDSQGNDSHLDDVWRLNPTTAEWTWMNGHTTAPSVCENGNGNTSICGWPTVYGSIGVSAPGIGPGSRVGAVTWTGSGSTVWLLGGQGTMVGQNYDFSAFDQYDLWAFDTSTNQWAWMSGNTTSTCGGNTADWDWCGQDGFYGELGVPGMANTPPSRQSAVTWKDSAGNLWLYGGAQPLTTVSYGSSVCDDLWVFEPSTSEWAWMNGESYPLQATQSCGFTFGSHGQLGVPNPAPTTPSGRLGSASWTDSSGNLWMFGGYGWASGSIYELNDFWVYKAVAPAPVPSLELIVSPNPINIPALATGAPAITTGTATVQMVTADGVQFPVTLTAYPSTVGGVMGAVTGSFSPATLNGNGTSTLTISVTGAAFVTGFSTPLTISASNGTTGQTVEVIVDVTSTGLQAPTFSPPPGTYSTPQNVTISETNSTNFVYYTTDGTTPTASSTVFVNPITIGSTTTFKAFSLAVNQQSAVTTATYTITLPAATPVFSLSGGSYSAAQQVTITDSTPGVTIYYTTDGSSPTTSSATYSGPITVSSTETLNAIAVGNGYSQSSVATAAYTITQPNFSITGTNISVSSGATTGNTSTITLTPVGGFTGAINLACAITPAAANDPATCSIPAAVTINGTSAATATLAIQTTPSVSGSVRLFGSSAGGAALACVLLVVFPDRRRRWAKGLAMMLLLLSVGGGAAGCGGNKGGAGGGGGGGGTSPGSYTVTVTGTAGSITQKATIALTVQ